MESPFKCPKCYNDSIDFQEVHLSQSTFLFRCTNVLPNGDRCSYETDRMADVPNPKYWSKMDGMESEEPLKRAAGSFDIYENKEICARYLCPYCGKDNEETDFTKDLPSIGDKVKCKYCGKISIVVKRP